MGGTATIAFAHAQCSTAVRRPIPSGARVGWRALDSPGGGHLAAFDGNSSRVVIIGRDGSDETLLDLDEGRYVAVGWLPAD